VTERPSGAPSRLSAEPERGSEVAEGQLGVAEEGTSAPAQGDPAVVALVYAAQQGDAVAMSDLLDLLQPRVARLCGAIALSEGPDAAQEALVAIFRSLRQLREPAALFGWARAIAVREALRVARRANRAAAQEIAEVPARGDPELPVDIEDVLSRLRPEHRAILVLRDLEGMDEHQASALLEIPPATVRTRLFRARRSFRAEWGR
jgi:RNA polymerase sigma-70 factor (ECF subfamily)